MAGIVLRHRGWVATAVAAAAFVVVGTARWAAGDAALGGQPWPSVVALAYGAVGAGVFGYLRTGRAREALAPPTDSSLAGAQVIVAVSPTVVASVLHLAGADVWVLWLVLGSTVAQLMVWSGFPKGWTSRE